MKNDPSIYLEHIVEAIEAIESYSRGLTKSDFLQSPITQDAILRRLEIIGEAARNIPVSIRQKEKNIPWEDIVAMRNILTHEYFGVDLEVVWKTVKYDLPSLRSVVEKLLNL